MPNLDAQDVQILKILTENARASFVEIAKQVGMPEATARYRVQKLFDGGVIESTVVTGAALRREVKVVIFTIECAPKVRSAVARAVAAIDGTVFVAHLSDIFAIISCPQYDRIAEVSEEIDQINGVIGYQARITPFIEKSLISYQSTLL